MDEATTLVVSYGGSLSGEHGDGQSRAQFLPKMFGDELVGAFRDFKTIWDPQRKMNPGKIVDAPNITDNLRFRPTYQASKPDTYFDYSDYGGLAGAVEMCSGVGACRKKLAGTMCPSYMATREESDTTRGRANALRLAMSGRLGETGLGDEDVYRALDLCRGLEQPGAALAQQETAGRRGASTSSRVRRREPARPRYAARIR